MPDQPPTRLHRYSEVFPHTPDRVFRALLFPSEIRSWWGATRAVVAPRAGGVWSAAWGANEDDADYMSWGIIDAFEPSNRLRIGSWRYYVRRNPPPSSFDLTVEFLIDPHPEGCELTVINDGFPLDPNIDGFFDSCGTGWKNTFAALRTHLGK